MIFISAGDNKMNIAEIQKEIASTICLIGDKIIQNDLPVEVIDTDNGLIRESKAKLLELLSEYDKEISIDFEKVPVMKNDISFLKSIRENRNWFDEEGNIMNFAGIAILC
jgi:hypothetical protein